MGNQQMAYASNPQQQQQATAEDPNEWFDSVSNVEDHERQINAPENNLVVNGILDELIDSLFESKLANRSSEVLTKQYLPEDQHNINQTKPTSYGEAALNWKGVAIPAESDSPDPLLPNESHVPSSSNNYTFYEENLVPEESENKNTAGTRNCIQNAIVNTSNKENKTLKDDGTLMDLQKPSNENMDSLREAGPKSDSIASLSRREDCDIFRNSLINENIKAFELTPKDAQRINQSSSKETNSFNLQLATLDKCAKNNYIKNMSQDSKIIKALTTKKTIRKDEKVLDKTVSSSENFSSNIEEGIKEESIKSLTVSANGCDSKKLEQCKLNESLSKRQNIIPKLSETQQEINKHKNCQNSFKLTVLDHTLPLPADLKIVPSSNMYDYQKTSMERETSINVNESQPIPIPDSEDLLNRKLPEEIEKTVITKDLESDVPKTKQENSIYTPDNKSVNLTEELSEVLNCTVDTPISMKRDSTVSKIDGLVDFSMEHMTNRINHKQHNTIAKESQEKESNLKELCVVSEDVKDNIYSIEIKECSIKDEKKCSMLKPVLNSFEKENTSSTTPKLVQDNTINLAEEAFQISLCSPIKGETGILNVKIESEDKKPVVVKHCDKVNDIPLVNKSPNAYASLVKENMSLIYSSEINSATSPKESLTLTISEDTEIPLSFEKEVESHSQGKELKKELIKANTSIVQDTSISAPSTLNDRSNCVEKEVSSSTKHIPFGSLVDLNVAAESSPETEDTQVKSCDNNGSTPSEELANVSVSLVERDKESSFHDSHTILTILPEDANTFNTSLNEAVKFKAFAKEAVTYCQDEEEKRKLDDVYSQIETCSCVTESINHSPSPILNEVPLNSIEKGASINFLSTPDGPSSNVQEVEITSLSPKTEKNAEIDTNCVASKDQFFDACTPLVEENKSLLLNNNSVVPPTNDNMSRVLTESRIHAEKENIDSHQHEEAKNKSNAISSQTKRLESMSASNESSKETDIPINMAISPEVKQYRNIYEEGNICDLDKVINQFRHKHNPVNAESYSKLDKRKSLLDKSNAKRTTYDTRKTSKKNVERSNLQIINESTKETKVSDIKTQNEEDISVCLDRYNCKTAISSQNNPKEENSAKVSPKEDIVDFRGVMAKEEQCLRSEQKSEPKKCDDTVKERETMEATKNSNGNADTKRERIPELKPETLKSLIADLSLNKSTTDVGCNTVEDWIKRDSSKAEGDWLNERKKLVGRITDLHQTQNATKFIVKELIYLVTSWMEGKDKDNVDLQETRQKLINERDQALEDLRSVEESFYELHRRYEKTKKLIEDYKKNEDILKRQIADSEEKLHQQKQMFDHLVKHSENKLEQANTEIFNMGKSKESEMAVLTAQLRKAEMKANSLEKALEQKVRENTELSSICEDLITKCGRK